MANRNGRHRSSRRYDFPVVLSKWLSTNGALLEALHLPRRRSAVYREFTRARLRGQHTAEDASHRARRLA
jgi:hypothetical protein